MTPLESGIAACTALTTPNTAAPSISASNNFDPRERDWTRFIAVSFHWVSSGCPSADSRREPPGDNPSSAWSTLPPAGCQPPPGGWQDHPLASSNSVAAVLAMLGAHDLAHIA